MSYKVAVKVVKESEPSYNGLRFATREEAKANAENLFSRWTAMTGYEIEESDDPVNYQWTASGLKEIVHNPVEA